MKKRQTIKEKFQGLPLKKKLLLTFLTLSTLLLIATDIALSVIVKNIGDSDFYITTTNDRLFTQISTSQIAKALTKQGVTGRDKASQLIFQLTLAYNYFVRNPRNLISVQSVSPHIPPLTSSFKERQERMALFFYTENSTFFDHSFIDVIVERFDKSNQLTLRRINVIYYNTVNQSDLMVRTFPATDDFVIREPADVAIRLQGLEEGYVDRTLLYRDKFSKKDTLSLLVAVRTVLIPKGNPYVRIIIEQELINQGLLGLLKTVYFFPSTNVLFIEPNVSGTWEVIDSTKAVDFDVAPFLQLGDRYSTLANGTSVVSGTVGLETHVKIDQFYSHSYSNKSKQRFVVITSRTDTDIPFNKMGNLIQNRNLAIIAIFVTWTIFILILVAALSIAVGDNVFRFLDQVNKRFRDYVANPKCHNQIILQLKCIGSKGAVKKLIRNVSLIIKKIETHKAQIQKCKPAKYRFPLNICQRSFQKKCGMIDCQIMDSLQQTLDLKFKPKPE